MRETIDVKKNKNGDLEYIWKAGRNRYILSSNWNYITPVDKKGTNLKETLKEISNDYDRVNKKLNIFRHSNHVYFYSDGNTDPWIITTYSIIRLLSKLTGRDYETRYLYLNRVKIVNKNSELVPTNILVDNLLLSDIIKEIFKNDSEYLKDYEFLLDFCDDTTELDGLFIELDEEKPQPEDVLKLLLSLSQEDQKKVITNYLNEVVK